VKVRPYHCIPRIVVCVGWTSASVGVDQPDFDHWLFADDLALPGLVFSGRTASMALVVVPVIPGVLEGVVAWTEERTSVQLLVDQENI
jgi:hypothetical protein